MVDKISKLSFRILLKKGLWVTQKQGLACPLQNAGSIKPNAREKVPAKNPQIINFVLFHVLFNKKKK